MAKTLFEALNESTQKVSAETKPGMTDETQAAQNLLATKATGRAIEPSSTPLASSQAEKQAVVQGQQKQQQQSLQQSLQATNLKQQAEAQQQRFDLQKKEGVQKVMAMEADFNRRADSMLQDFESGLKKLDDEKHALDVETLSHQARLGNKKYVHELDMNAKRSGLDDNIKFAEEMARTTLGDELDFLNDKLAHQRFISGSNREFQVEMAKMDINLALQAANESLKAANEQQKWQGINGLVSAGISAMEHMDTDTVKVLGSDEISTELESNTQASAMPRFGNTDNIA